METLEMPDDQFGEDAPAENLNRIERQNAESTNQNRFHGFYSPDWSENHE